MKDIILDYIVQNSEIIGVDRPPRDNENDFSDRFIDHYLYSDEGYLFYDFYKILVFFDQNPPPQDILDELKKQLNSMIMFHIIQNVTICVDQTYEGDVPDFLVDMFGYFKKYGYQSNGNHFLESMSKIIQHLL